MKTRLQKFIVFDEQGQRYNFSPPLDARETALHVYFLLFLSFLFPLKTLPEGEKRRTGSATKRNLLNGRGMK